MPRIPAILVNDSNELHWRLTAGCPRNQNLPEKQFFCPVRDRCTLPVLLVGATDQPTARRILIKTKLTTCADGKNYGVNINALPQGMSDFDPYSIIANCF
ncbi:hypothetical protein KBC75_02950 [Candidatus Shapirobacteria bacterium]|nr:hypothetical protein [Candidatus Shapirobacteria bacterium]